MRKNNDSSEVNPFTYFQFIMFQIPHGTTYYWKSDLQDTLESVQNPFLDIQRIENSFPLPQCM